MENATESGHTSKANIIVIINCALNVPLMFISIVGNALVLAAIFRTPSLRSPSYVFLSSLAASDLLVGLVVQPLYIANEITGSSMVSMQNKVGHMTAFFTCGVSLCTTAAMSVDRYLALHYHLRYPVLVTTSRVFYTLTIIWLIDFLCASIHFWDIKLCYLVMAGGIGLCVLVATFSYIKIYRIVCRHLFQIQAQHQQSMPHQASSNTAVTSWIRSKKSAVNTFVFYIFIIPCYFPKAASLTIYSISPKKWNNVWVFASTVLFLNSSFNPLLYCWRIRELRRVVLNLLRKIF